MVGDRKYSGDRVLDGLFESIFKLKSLNIIQLASSPHHSGLMQDYENVKFICNNKNDIPQVSIQKSSVSNVVLWISIQLLLVTSRMQA